MASPMEDQCSFESSFSEKGGFLKNEFHVQKMLPNQANFVAISAQLIMSVQGEGFVTSSINAKLAGSSSYFDDGICHPSMWKNKKAVGKVILCFSTRGSITNGMAEQAALLANASGLIFVEPLSNQIADVDFIPTVRVDMIEGTKLNDLLAESIFLPKVQIQASKTVIGKSPAPVVAYFSSRGPSTTTPDILKTVVTIKRTVCNVGQSKTAVYFVSTRSPDGVEVEVWPRVMIFSYFKEEMTYYVTLKPRKKSQGRFDYGEIIWSDGFHYVRSPLVVCVNTTEDSIKHSNI
ncbi:Subtilisin-like protease, fibronectin type-III domain [Dillenia turbinata]|uniref:Subtilisin-like protease, fibronectin type-III domain n=1 Tax=Dillenia turbinata TaxID=194707 RepID=A0AAN8VWB2_9MAGN